MVALQEKMRKSSAHLIGVELRRFSPFLSLLTWVVTREVKTSYSSHDMKFRRNYFWS